ncbi:response regulator transcription factor [Dactylosporangium roseum]|uniref:Response regulator transcription factor n=1 Tax=Dactylosporangium roseum TaxID=47989 RepID=A0ABY5Z2J6_9ACTN|nr:response regulator transcription factor [Dactylosporangium roseum]UWZ36245.1 response regulator transcription factor [Dactylosporangium roseum]
MSIRVLIADDQDIVRDGLRRILTAAPDIDVVGEAADGVQALEQATELVPDVALVDIRMPRMDGLALTRHLAGGPTKVVVVTTFDLDEYVYPALRDGASGFLLKRSGSALLVEAVRAAVAGDSLISPSITVRLLKHVTAPRPPRAPVPEPLTERELEVAAHVGAGRTNAEIGAELFISAGTVKTHIAAVQRKLGVRNRVGIAVWAWDSGNVAT